MRGVRNLGEIQGSNFSSIAGFGLRSNAGIVSVRAGFICNPTRQETCLLPSTKILSPKNPYIKMSARKNPPLSQQILSN
jgi:hypothetical protein